MASDLPEYTQQILGSLRKAGGKVEPNTWVRVVPSEAVVGFGPDCLRAHLGLLVGAGLCRFDSSGWEVLSSPGAEGRS